MFFHIIHLNYNILYLYEYNLEHLIIIPERVTFIVYSLVNIYMGSII
jgi:hypothetical protein